MNGSKTLVQPNKLLKLVPDRSLRLTGLLASHSLTQLSHDESLVYETFPSDATVIDQIIEKSGLPPGTMSSRLLALERAVVSDPRWTTRSKG